MLLVFVSLCLFEFSCLSMSVTFQKSHAMHVNQLLVTVEGWQRLTPVSVDKVGVYFRHAEPELKAPVSVFSQLVTMCMLFIVCISKCSLKISLLSVNLYFTAVVLNVWPENCKWTQETLKWFWIFLCKIYFVYEREFYLCRWESENRLYT